MIYLSTPQQVHFFKFVCATILDLGLLAFLIEAINQRRISDGGQS